MDFIYNTKGHPRAAGVFLFKGDKITGYTSQGHIVVAKIFKLV